MKLDEARRIVTEAAIHESDLPLYEAACVLLKMVDKSFDAGYLSCEIDEDLRDDFDEDEQALIKEFGL
jgi:hypothetical protein